ncbi:MAG: hypothetical protein AAF639_16175, partial [Chloroflexota bacterium]
DQKEIERPRWVGYVYAYWNNPSVIVWWMLAKGVNWLVEISQKPIENQIERLSGQAPHLLNTSWEKPVSEGVVVYFIHFGFYGWLSFLANISLSIREIHGQFKDKQTTDKPIL